MNVVVVVPSRGRPERAMETLRSIRDTQARVSTRSVLVVDRSDPELPRYREMIASLMVGEYRDRPSLVVLDDDETGNLVKATNTVSLRIAAEDPRCIIGNLGDDHVIRSPGWDKQVLEALETPGIAYGDDLLQGAHLPTAPFISASIVLALGWYALPTCHHMYIDDAWKTLGQNLGILRFLPDVIIEHVHPAARKVEWDEGYDRANASMEQDRLAFEDWKRRFLALDAANIRPLI